MFDLGFALGGEGDREEMTRKFVLAPPLLFSSISG